MWEKWNHHPPGVASRRATNVWIANVQFHLQKQICIQHDLLCEARRLPSLQNMAITIRQKCRIKGICIYVHSEWVPSSSSNYNQLTKCIAAIKFLILFIFSCSSPVHILFPTSNNRFVLFYEYTYLVYYADTTSSTRLSGVSLPGM